MFKRLRAAMDDIGTGPPLIWHGQTLFLGQLMDNAVKIRCQNIADWYWENDKERWFLTEDFPNVSPSWNLAWFEWRQRARMTDGVLVPAIDCGVLLAVTKEWSKPYPIHELTGQEMRWAFNWITFTEMPRGVLSSEIQLAISTEGRILGESVAADGRYTFTGRPINTCGLPAQDAINVSLLELNIPCLALCMANCSNTIVKEDVQTIRKGKPKPLDPNRTVWHILEINGTKELIRRVSGGVGGKKGLHLARGHLKDFRKGKGLFGKHKGLYWWDQQMRGSKEAGTIKKDYAV